MTREDPLTQPGVERVTRHPFRESTILEESADHAGLRPQDLPLS